MTSRATQLGVDIHRVIDAARHVIMSGADTIAAEHNEPNEEILAAIMAGCGVEQSEGQKDGRETKWRCRIRIYDQSTPKADPLADSEHPAPAEAEGTWIISGLHNVVSEAARLACVQVHEGATLRGLGATEQAKKLRGFRPTLARTSQSRGKGEGTLRLEYDTLESFSEARDHVPRYLIRIDVKREN